jgi:3-dehydroquinate synthase
MRSAGIRPGFVFLLPNGEQNKNFSKFQAALQALADFSRGPAARPVVVVLGGGVAGDLGGFTAAAYRRGVPFVQIPSTLLSMVDSSVGGKTGVDFETKQGVIKNLVGAFYQPSKVLVDPLLLRTLPAREVRSGYAEVVKTLALFDPKLFKVLEANVVPALALEPALMTRLIAACVAHKAAMVEKDEFDDRGFRALLNLGHTFGHALEAASRFSLRHGEAVSLGLACACDLSLSLGVAKAGHDLLRLEGLLMRLGLPVRLTGVSLDEVKAAMTKDKKFDGSMKFVLLKRLGQGVVAEVKSMDKVAQVLKFRIV